MDYQKIIDSLSEEELIGQLLCYDIYGKNSFEEVDSLFKRVHPGAFFFQDMDKEKLASFIKIANKNTPLPVLVSCDAEAGPGMAINGEPFLTQEMAWGAANDTSLIYEAGVSIGERCRELGANYNFSPIVDLSLNFEATSVNIRAISDDPDLVIDIAGAYIKGLQHNGNMAATIKHFPGEGVDSRNPHFLTTENPMTKEEWWNTYGKVYKKLIDEGAMSVMVAHSSVPAIEKEKTKHGYMPACLSKSLITDVLKGEMGFEGVVVSDALSMIGAASAVDDLNSLAVDFINAGGDLVLFPDDNDFSNILNAYRNGVIKKERIYDAVTRILKLKEKLHLLDPSFEVKKESKRSIEEIGEEIALKAVKVVRNEKGILPLKLKKGSKILLVSIFEPYFHRDPTGLEFSALKEEFLKEGYQIDELFNPDHHQINKVLNDYDAIIVASKFGPNNYHGGTFRVGWYNAMAFWRGYILKHPRLVFVSFGDPYKLYDYPYLATYVNAFSDTYPSQRAVTKILLGKEKERGKNPISFPPYFLRETVSKKH